MRTTWYRDKFRLAQLLIQLARKEEEEKNPEKRKNSKKESSTTDNGGVTEDNNSIEYVAKRLLKLRPAKEKSLRNSIRAMYQFQGAISEADEDKVIAKLKKKKYIEIDSNKRVTYL